jgi:hypothetical protein
MRPAGRFRCFHGFRWVDRTKSLKSLSFKKHGQITAQISGNNSDILRRFARTTRVVPDPPRYSPMDVVWVRIGFKNKSGTIFRYARNRDAAGPRNA